MFGYIYITTNLVNDKKYIGKKKSSKFDPKYLGSGKLLWQAIEKYGKENFSSEIIEEVNGDMTLLNEREVFYITKYNAVESDQFYNIKPGGDGGRGSGWHHNDHFKQLMHEMQKDGKSWMVGKKHSEETKRKMSESRTGCLHPMYGKKHSEETRKKISEKVKMNPPSTQGYGELNPMFHRVWVTNGIDSKAVLQSDLSYYESIGYKKGRLVGKWMTNGKDSRMVLKKDQDKYLKLGYRFGRTTKRSAETIERIAIEKDNCE